MADIALTCSHCEQKIEVQEEMAGMKVECPACQGELQIPKRIRILTLCPLCDGSIDFPMHRLGELIKCPHCNGAIELGSASALPKPPSAPIPAWKPPQRSSDWQLRFVALFNETLQGFRGNVKPAATNEELQIFIQSNSYYYIPQWQSFDETLNQKSLGVFNWAACFFNLFWMAYRKMYLYTAVLWVLFGVILTVVDRVTDGQAGNYTWFGMMFLLGRYGNSIFKNHTERKIRQIKKEVPPEYREQAFKAHGGTSWLATIPLIILQLLAYYGIYLLAVQKAQHNISPF